jgi:glutamate racemase
VKIGFFDSGIGGFSILKHMRREFLSAEIYYIADDSFAPYGEKSDDSIRKRCFEMVTLLVEQGVDAIVVACNTATAVCIEELRESFEIPFIGVEPYINILNDDSWDRNNKGCVITTALTAKSKRFRKLKDRLDPNNELDYFSSPRLAVIIEKFFYTKNKVVLNKEVFDELKTLNNKHYTHFILGCTHYPLISEVFEELFRVECVSPCQAIVLRLKEVLGNEEQGLLKNDFKFLSTISSKKTWQTMKKSELNNLTK